MENALAIAKVIGPIHVILGLSILLYGPSWQKLATKWAENHFSLFAVGIIQGIGGLIILNLYHELYPTPWLIITFIGWVMLIKSIVFFLLPGAITRWGVELLKSKIILYSGGILVAVLGGILSYFGYIYNFI